MEDRVRELFAETPLEWEFERRSVVEQFSSVDEMVAIFEHDFGPLVVARAALEPQGKWEALHNDFVAFCREQTTELDGGIGLDAEYLMAIGHKRG